MCRNSQSTLSYICICKLSSSGPGHVHIGNSDVISRVHCELVWDESKGVFNLKCKSKNGCLVDGKQVNDDAHNNRNNNDCLVNIVFAVR
jgi:hypothetical protein